MEKDIITLANTVNHFYMPKLKKDIESAKTEVDKELLQNIYNGYKRLINKYLD